jgi:hypothetical protein
MRGIFCIFLTFCLLQSISAQTDLVNRNKPLPVIGKTFSIVAHIVVDSSGTAAVDSVTLKNEIGLMNKYFSPIGVKFEICKINRVPDYTLYDLTDKKEYQELWTQYRVDNRINMYFCNSYPDGEMFGEAEPNGISKPDSANILVLSAHASAARMAHLMGHFFGLVHTFETKGELVDGSNCLTSGDNLCDTPADPFELGETPEDYLSTQEFCRFTDRSKDSAGQYFVPDVGNIMSMYFMCYCSFSQDQLRLMAENYILSSSKLW